MWTESTVLSADDPREATTARFAGGMNVPTESPHPARANVERIAETARARIY
jgi:hypothetical protein